MTVTVTVAVVDDHELTTLGVEVLLRSERDLEFVGHAATATEALHLIETERPQVLLVDYRLPDMTGSELCRTALTRSPHLRILVITAYIDHNTVVSALRGGATGFIGKDIAARDLVALIRRIADGEVVIDPRAMRFVRDSLRLSGPAAGEHPQLTQRELEILGCLADDQSNKEIAQRLNLAVSTVKSHLENIYEKLGCSGRHEAVRVAVEYGFLNTH